MMQCGGYEGARGELQREAAAAAAGGGAAGGGGGAAVTAAAVEAIERLAGGGAVVVFSVSTCCMCHVVKSLLCGMGVNLTVYELDELEAATGLRIEEALRALVGGGGGGAGATSGGGSPPLPAVFVGGKLLGGLDHVMAAHISGALVPLLKDAGALWL